MWLLPYDSACLHFPWPFWVTSQIRYFLEGHVLLDQDLTELFIPAHFTLIPVGTTPTCKYFVLWFLYGLQVFGHWGLWLPEFVSLAKYNNTNLFLNHCSTLKKKKAMLNYSERARPTSLRNTHLGSHVQGVSCLSHLHFPPQLCS